MDNKEIIQEIILAFDNSDIETILRHVTDDIVWEMRDDKGMVVKGKENLLNFFSEYNEMRMVGSTKDHIIVDVDQVAVDGIVQMQGKDAVPFEMYYCDIYELKDGKINRMISYVNKKL
jgi:ketosteroid isomerase-like protein